MFYQQNNEVMLVKNVLKLDSMCLMPLSLIIQFYYTDTCEILRFLQVEEISSNEINCLFHCV
jgi:hypothetical protein